MSDPAERLAATPPGVALGPLDAIADGAARTFVLAIGERRFHGFVVRAGAAVRNHVDRCPQMGLPLARTLDDYLTPDGALIARAWHGALFATADGACVGGPAGARPVVVDDGHIVTSPG